jgi:competence protein ComEA
VVVLLLCAIPATLQYCRHVHRQEPARIVRPQRIVYELRGDVTQPGIYRYGEEQTTAELAGVCGAERVTDYTADNVVATGTRLLFNNTGTAFGRMEAALLLSYHLPISLAAASARDLELIPGIGPKTARALIDYYEHAGPVQRIEQLVEIRGIGPKKLKKIARYLRP